MELHQRNANHKRDQAGCINGRIRLPVAWEPAIKDVLYGLLENSWGDGRSRATVQHIRLLDDMRLGKLSRRKGDFLCTSPSATNGKAYCNSHKEEFTDGQGKRYDAPVTCKSCLQIAARLEKRAE